MGLDVDAINKIIHEEDNTSSIDGKQKKKMGRPPKEVVRDKVVKVYLTSLEKKKLEKIINSLGTSSSEFLAKYVKEL